MNKFKDTKWLVRLSALVAIVIVMSFTPIGYVKLGAVEISFLMIPVAFGAITLGQQAGIILGAAFGITSFIQALTTSPFGAALVSIDPLLAGVVCIVPRVLEGWLTSLIFQLNYKHDKSKGNIVSFTTASIACPVLNTVLFMTALMLCFGNSSYIADMRGGMGLFAFLVAFVGLNGLVEIIVSTVIGVALSKSLFRFMRRDNK